MRHSVPIECLCYVDNEDLFGQMIIQTFTQNQIPQLLIFHLNYMIHVISAISIQLKKTHSTSNPNLSTSLDRIFNYRLSTEVSVYSRNFPRFFSGGFPTSIVRIIQIIMDIQSRLRTLTPVELDEQKRDFGSRYTNAAHFLSLLAHPVQVHLLILRNSSRLGEQVILRRGEGSKCALSLSWRYVQLRRRHVGLNGGPRLIENGIETHVLRVVLNKRLYRRVHFLLARRAVRFHLLL